MTEKYVWPNIKKQVRKWAKACIRCQKCKFTRHTKSEFGEYQAPGERFSIVHIDLIGPLSPSEGMMYCLTCIDRFSCWMEIVPLPDITAEIAGKAFYEHWICRLKPAYLLEPDHHNEQSTTEHKNTTPNPVDPHLMPDKQSTISHGRKINRPVRFRE
ncbi:retrovirus-related Pol polyprotein from transposon opus [Nephila pilipes]|uniref:Retrovirus-related Pol polyprotein from transposon opus n=1 Tax=Nephila pilipes TaxID=299642 RepID=A0A8X6UHK5_NEPPI|nr:retrovirus-related Pol polyprotein from transposon opus [Nephila pilipes]